MFISFLQLEELQKQNEELKVALQDQMHIIQSLLTQKSPKVEGLEKKNAELKAEIDSMQNEMATLKKKMEEVRIFQIFEIKHYETLLKLSNYKRFWKNKQRHLHLGLLKAIHILLPP